MTNVLINAPKSAKRGSVVEIKALILHPMETGFRPGSEGALERLLQRAAKPFDRRASTPETFLRSAPAKKPSLP